MPSMQTGGSPVTDHRVEANGIRLHYKIAGSGEPVVLLHGFPETSHAWRKVIPAMSARFTVIAPDLRGCGASDRPDGGYDKRTVAEDIHQLVQRLGLGPINLVGHDVGMMVAYAYAAAYPKEIRRLMLMEAALPGLGLEELYDAAKHPRMYHLPLFEAPNGLAEALIAGREKVFVSHFMRQQAYDPTGPDEDALEEYAPAFCARRAAGRHRALPRAPHRRRAQPRERQEQAAHARPDDGRYGKLRGRPGAADPSAGRGHAERDDRRVRPLPGRGATEPSRGRSAAVFQRSGLTSGALGKGSNGSNRVHRVSEAKRTPPWRSFCG